MSVPVLACMPVNTCMRPETAGIIRRLRPRACPVTKDATMHHSLSLLFVTCSEELADGIVHSASECGLHPAYSLVGSAQELSRALAEESWDIILAEPHVAGMPWQQILAAVRRVHEGIPFVLVMPAPDPQAAAQAVHDGADEVLLPADWHTGAALQRLRSQAVLSRRQGARRRSRADDEKEWRALVENTMVGMFRCRPWGELVQVNPAFAAIFGYRSPQELLNAHAGKKGPHVPAAEIKELLPALRNEGLLTEYEMHAARPDGSGVWLSVNARTIRGAAGEISGIEGTVEDIGNRKSVENMIVRAKQEWEKTFDSVPDIIVLLDSDLHIRRCNMALGTLLGRHPRELVGQDSRKTLFDGGTHGPVLDSLPALSRGQSHTEELHLPALGGHFLITFSPLFTGTGSDAEPEGTVLVARDISSRKQLEAQLRQAQKMEAIGTLAGGIAHDFNNILGVMMGYTEMSMDETTEGSAMQRRLDAVLSAGRRARDLIHQILTFSRHEEPSRHPLNLVSPVKETVKLLRASLPANIAIDLRTDTVPPVNANLSQIQQVVMNLCANAAHAMRGPGGNLLLALDSTLLTAEEARPLSVSAGTYVRLRVSDTGHGIDPQILHSIFDPFFTTKKPDEGTGMGLALVHGIITAHGGTVSVSSVPGQGTDFTILLPATDGQNVSEPGGSLRHAGSGIVLVVDDEKALAGVMADMLQSMGYTPRIADSPAQALHMVSRAPQEFALVLTDQTMPDMTGTELAARLHAVRPDLPVILCTGFSEGLTREAARKAGISELLLKPVLRGDLAKALACLEFDCGL